jgi:hypothetical protein
MKEAGLAEVVAIVLSDGEALGGARRAGVGLDELDEVEILRVDEILVAASALAPGGRPVLR